MPGWWGTNCSSSKVLQLSSWLSSH